MTRFRSITHKHIANIIRCNIHNVGTDRIRILDVGCGNGYLIADLFEYFYDSDYEIFGFDVHDHGVQKDNFMFKTHDYLTLKFPTIDWENRVLSIYSNQAWPYQDGFFDVVISNQVIEHVRNHQHFVSELSRVMKIGAFSVHLFHLGHHVYERHLNLPFVHWIKNYDLIYLYVKFLSFIGLGKYKTFKENISLNDFSERHADYICHYTNYLNCDDILRISKRNNLRATFRYTPILYFDKLLSFAGLNASYTKKISFIDNILFYVLRYISMVTLYMEKKDSYK